MGNSTTNKVKNNLVFGFVGQLIVLAVSILLPRLIISSYGSDLNGLTSAITQVFTYIALLEAGIGNASLNLLYKNIAEGNKKDISATVSATKTYFKRIVPLYILAVLAFLMIYPMVVKTDAEPWVIRAVILLQGGAGIVNFYCSNTFTQLLLADGRNYVVSNLNLMVKVFSAISQIILINLGFDIVVIQGSYLLFYIVKAIILSLYVRKKYPWLHVSKKGNTAILEQRSAFMVHEISNVVFQSTDVFIISTFCNTMLASVYSVYNLVYTSLNSFISIFNKGIDFILGQEYNKGLERYIKIHDAYESVYMAVVFSSMTVACILTLPFVTIYTAGITDINYIDEKLPVLFATIQVLSCCRAVSAKLIAVSGHAKNTQPNTIIEAILNLGCSVVLVQFLGMYGVLFGTIAALLYRTNDIIIYANKKILNRKPIKTYRNVAIYFMLYFVFLYFSHFIDVNCKGVLEFLLTGIITSIIVFGTYMGAALLLDKNAKLLIKRVFSKKITI